MKRRGKGLFWKIFGGFLLAQMLLTAITFAVTYALLLRSQANAWRDISSQTILVQSQFLKPLIENKKGQFQGKAVEKFCDEVSSEDFKFSLFDAQGKKLAGRTLPSSVQALREKTLDEISPSEWEKKLALAAKEGTQLINTPLMELNGSRVVGVQAIVGRTGRRYFLGAEMPRVDVTTYGKTAEFALTISTTITTAEKTSGITSSVAPSGTTSDSTSVHSHPDEMNLELVRPGTLAARVTPASNLTNFDAVPAMATTSPESSLFNWENMLLRTLALFLVAGSVCYGLAVYLTAPVEALRKATEQVASGDLTARVGNRFMRRRDELSDLGHDFDRMAERLETLVDSQRRLLADISHELRSPLARLAVASELAKQDGNAAVQPSLQRIDAEADRMGELISQLLTFTKLENGLVNTVSERFNLADLVEEIAANADFEASAKNCVVTIQTPDEVWLSGSRPLMERAIENVVRNAVRYSDPGKSVQVELAHSQSQATLTVRDHGPGVPENLLIHLCEPFYRVDGARDGSGVGLGLSISQRAVESHGGDISISNAPGGGLLVEIRLPIARS